MSENEITIITVETTVNLPVAKVWNYWNTPEDIVQWNSPSGDWHTTRSENDLRVGGKIFSRMEAKDGSMGFDFIGTYDEIEKHEHIAYTIADGRKVHIRFSEKDGQTLVVENFDAENENPVEMQRAGWQAIMDSFKTYAEAKG